MNVPSLYPRCLHCGARKAGSYKLAIDTELRSNHPERVDIFYIMSKDRHVAVEVGGTILLLGKSFPGKVVF